MKEKYGGGGGSGGWAVWEIMFVLFLVLFAAVALAQQAELGLGHEKRVTIHGKHEDKRAIERLADESLDDVEIETGPKTIIKLKGRFKIDRNKPVEEAAVDFIDRHRNAFGLKNPKEELQLEDEKNKRSSILSFQQTYNGVPVWQKGIGVLVNRENNEILQIGSNLASTPDIDTTPQITKEEAIGIARADKIAKEGGEVVGPRSKLYICKNKLAYGVGFLYRSHGWRYFIDATDGRILYKCDVTSYDGTVNATGTRYTGPPDSSDNSGDTIHNY